MSIPEIEIRLSWDVERRSVGFVGEVGETKSECCGKSSLSVSWGTGSASTY